MKHTLATTRTEGYTYDEYVCFCEDHGIEPTEEGSTDFYEWAAEEARINWEEDVESIKNCKGYNVPVVVCGTLGLWNGMRKVGPVRVDSVSQAIGLCGGQSIEEMDIVWVDGAIMVYAYHHDGTNIFEISALNKKGLAKKYAAYKPHDVKKLPYLYK